VLRGIRIVAAVRCAPPENKPTAQEQATCRPWLQRDLELAAPHLRSVLTLGSIGWDAALAGARAVGWTVPQRKPRFAHGAEAELGLPDGRIVRLVASYHVSPHNTFTKRLTPEMLDAVLSTL
jgi:uracil-DNA glycosylase